MRCMVYETVRCPSVRLSVPTWTRSLLWARRAGDTDRLLQQRRAAGECGQCHVVSVRSIGEQTCLAVRT